MLSPLAGPCSAKYRRCPTLLRVLSCFQQQLLRARDLIARSRRFSAQPGRRRRMALTSPSPSFCLADSFQLFSPHVAVYILHSHPPLCSPSPSHSPSPPNLKCISALSLSKQKGGGIILTPGSWRSCRQQCSAQLAPHFE